MTIKFGFLRVVRRSIRSVSVASVFFTIPTRWLTGSGHSVDIVLIIVGRGPPHLHARARSHGRF